ncbi:metallophosphoesterase, partial [Candidatus Woesearchaeota archaeon]|nr:metallophosphoesterase [Candidatus Woesearchaeota archaeon]
MRTRIVSAMVIAVLSDIHANLEALDAVIADCQAKDAEEILCLGDIAGYGPDPRETIESCRELEDLGVFRRAAIGNHDMAIEKNELYLVCNKLARAIFDYHKQLLTPEQRAYLRTMPLMTQRDDLLFVHGSLDCPENFKYITENEPRKEKNETRLKDQFALMKPGQKCFTGHTHVPRIYIEHPDGRIEIHYI